MADIFLSYSSDDLDRVRKIVDALEERGFSVWWDRRIDLGTSFDKSIEHELDAAKCVLVVWSKSSVQSEWVINEASEGQNRGVLVPIRIDDVRVPLAFRRLQTADIDPRLMTGFDSVVEAVSRYLSREISESIVDQGREGLLPAWRSARSLSLFTLLIAIAILSTIWMFGKLDGEGPAEHSTSQAKRVAILPFRDLSSKQDLQWLADGVQMRLAQIIGNSSTHQVIPSPLAQRMISEGALEGIDLLLTGTLQQELEQNRMIVELTDVESKEQIWIQEFVSHSDDLFESQQRMARRISRYFNSTLENDSVPQVPAAWAHYLKYLHFQWGGAFDQEVYWLQRTLQEDPEWSLGWTALTIQLVRRAAVLKEDLWIDQARLAAERACQSSSDADPVCKSARAEIAMWLDGDFELAERIYREIAKESGWYTGYGVLLLTSGLTEEAARLFKRLSETLPFFPPSWDWLSTAHGVVGEERTALEYANEFARLVPEDSVVPALNRGIIAAKLDRFEEARKVAERFEEAARSADRNSDYEFFTRFGSRLISAKISTRTNNLETAMQYANELVEQDAIGFAAAVYLEIGDPLANKFFKEAASNPHFYRRSLPYITLYLDSEFHSQPAFLEFLISLGQSPAWQLELCNRLDESGPLLDVRCSVSTRSQLEAANFDMN